MPVNSAEKRTLAGLARELGVKRQTIYIWQNLFPNETPAVTDYDAWRAFCVEKNLTEVGNKIEKDRETLLREKLQEEIKLLKTKNAKEEKTVADRAEVDELFLHISTLQKTILFQRLGRELGPKCQGKTAGEMNAWGLQLANEIADIFTSKVEQWQSS